MEGAEEIFFSYFVLFGISDIVFKPRPRVADEIYISNFIMLVMSDSKKLVQYYLLDCDDLGNYRFYQTTKFCLISIDKASVV